MSFYSIDISKDVNQRDSSEIDRSTSEASFLKTRNLPQWLLAYSRLDSNGQASPLL